MLHKACYERASLADIQVLFENDPTALNESSKNGMLPLHVACLGGCSLDVVQYLLKKNPTALMAVDQYLQLPLHLACFSHVGPSREIIQYLVQQRPDSLKARDDDYSIPLHLACVNMNEPSLGVIQFFLENDPKSFMAQDIDGCTALHCICDNTYDLAVNKSVNVLLKNEDSEDSYERDTKLSNMQRARLSDVQIEMVCMILKVHPKAMFIKNKRGRTPRDIVERCASSASLLERMKRFETPQMSEFEQMKKDLANARAEIKAKNSKIDELETALRNHTT